jgi:hypothetical protein
MKSFDSGALESILSHRNPTGNLLQEELPDIPDMWTSTQIDIPTECPECGSFSSHEINERGVVEFTCDNRCSASINKEKFTRYNVEYENIIQNLASYIGFEYQSIKQDLPRYISSEVNVPLETARESANESSAEEGTEEEQIIEKADLRIIISPDDIKKEIRNTLFEVSVSNKPSLVFVKTGTISELLETQSLYASGDLIHFSTLQDFPKSNRLNRRLRNMCKIKKLESDMKQNLESNTDSELIKKVDSNPRYILTELNHMLTLRNSGEIKRWEGDRLEKVTESAFSHIFATLQGRGGQDDNFEKIPDTVFYVGELQNNTGAEPTDPILGVVDAKSGSPAGFSTEKIGDKQIDYVAAARKRQVPADKLAHIFVTTHISSKNDLDFHDRIQDRYSHNEHMVVMTVEGLMQLMEIYLSTTLSDQVSLETNIFVRAARSLFDPDEFYEIGNDKFTRETIQPADQDEYDSRYAAKHDLLLITPEVVKNNFEHYMKEDPDIEGILTTYIDSI